MAAKTVANSVGEFDERAYLIAYPDVAAELAKENRTIQSAWDHYNRFGRTELREARPIVPFFQKWPEAKYLLLAVVVLVAIKAAPKLWRKL